LLVDTEVRGAAETSHSEARERAVPTPPGQPGAPANEIIYAVGDVHGRLDLLRGVTAEIARAAAAARAPDRVIAVFLGDYIDRGPDTRGVIGHLIDFAASGVCETVFLRGNHEQILLDLVDADQAADPVMWLTYGGLDTLKAYGVTAPFPVTGRDAETVSERVRQALPEAHLAFLRATRLTEARGDYLFVHAGLRPDRLLSEQSETDLLWHRFIDDRQPAHGKVVVHGHTPRPAPVVGRWRIGIDTEAYASGGLTAVRLEGAERLFLNFQSEAAVGGAGPNAWDHTDPPPTARRRKGRGRWGPGNWGLGTWGDWIGAGGSQARARAASARGRTFRIVTLTRAVFAVLLLGVMLVLAWLYVGHANAEAPPSRVTQAIHR
jgi:serine/threonine protein phosphatase 1